MKTNNQPLVSVIIPVFNAMPFLEETLNSVFHQSYDNIEIIVVDDGSKDGSVEFLESLSISNLKLVSNSGEGACAARNYGFKLSKGDYIQFLDADDLLSPDKIESQVKALSTYTNSIAVCTTAHFYKDPSEHKITDKDFLYTTNKPQAFLLKLYGADGERHNMVQTSAWLTPRSLLEKAGAWDESLSKDQDGEFFCRVVTQSDNVVYVPEVKNYYRKHIKGSNIANKKQRQHLESQLKALESKAKQLKDVEDINAYNNAMALQYKLIAINAYPKFKDISKISLDKSKAFGGSLHLPVLGGKMIETIKSIFGWKLAKAFSYWVHKFDFR